MSLFFLQIPSAEVHPPPLPYVLFVLFVSSLSNLPGLMFPQVIFPENEPHPDPSPSPIFLFMFVNPFHFSFFIQSLARFAISMKS